MQVYGIEVAAPHTDRSPFIRRSWRPWCSRDVFRLTERRVSPGFLRLFPGLTFASENSGLYLILYDVLEMKEQVETAPDLVHLPIVNILTPYGYESLFLSFAYRLNPWMQSKELDRQVEKAKA